MAHGMPKTSGPREEEPNLVSVEDASLLMVDRELFDTNASKGLPWSTKTGNDRWKVLDNGCQWVGMGPDQRRANSVNSDRVYVLC
jgi:hypothetical protein